MDLRQSLRRRVGSYKRFSRFALMMETDFKGIFTKVQRELGLKEYDISRIINEANEEQIKIMHDKLSEYQLSNKYGW